ncbi:MSCRAMM family protein [Micromonospora inositola]|uniref:Carboxypeptidase regulatory-like domain-containing protein n=1 Tax=Micromonospora inositola TaxID=47865 RepID=A0A1C5I9Z2_9ACTN|nr:carboxypeptidase-like regulatory domain-containing protein [Micromonospora inositola]SCG55220.1 Carboxypeptidase regulatory-like domain-containing protein [Micromonospora inositola]
MRLTKRWMRALAATAVVAAVLAAAPAAQAVPTYTATGTVTDRATGAPLPGACLTLFNAPDRVIATRCADEQGRYTFSGLTRTIQPRLRAQAAGHAELWWPAEPDYYNADPLRYPTDGSTTIEANLALLDAVGGFAGRITQPDGSPAYASEVTAVSTVGVWRAKAPTDSDGRYRLGNLPVGSYRLAIGPRGWDPTQWLPGTGNPPVVTVFDVTPGATTTVDGRYLTTTGAYEGGVLTGTVTAATGAPVAGACVTAVSVYSGQEAATACTDATGRYRITTVSYNLGYKLRVNADGYPEQWAPNAVDSRNASTYFPAWGQDKIVNVALRTGGGTVRGQITDYPDATPALTNSVRVEAVDGSWSAWTEAVDGRYQFDRVPAGDYRVAVKPLDRTIQYHPGKPTPAEATVVHIADGEVTTVDEQLVPPGAVEVTLTDAVTGAPVKGCARLFQAQEVACGDTGTITFPKVWATGTTLESLLVDAKPTHWTRTVSSVRVVTGETTRLTVTVEPGAALETSVVDARDASVPPKTCVYAVSAEKLATTPMRREATSYCSDTSGKVRIGPLPPGPVQLLVVPPAPYGAQWYTENGGTGDRRVAEIYSMQVGQTVTAPPIRLDLAGKLTGRVKDQAGSPVDTCVQPVGLHPDFVDVPPVRACATGGSYVLDRLGPYRWPLGADGRVLSSGAVLAPGWSGNVDNRFEATLVQVTAGTTTTVPDIVLPRGAQIRRLDLGTAASQGGVLEVYQPTTGDRVWYPVGVESVITVPLPAGPVLLRLLPNGGKPCWYVGPRTFLSARAKQGPKPVTLTAGQVIDTFRLAPGDTCGPVPVTRALPPRPGPQG